MARTIGYIQGLKEAIDEEMARDPSVFVMGEDIIPGTFGVTAGLAEKYGLDRVRNTPISELGFTAAGLGAAMAGARPIIEIQFASLIYMCIDPLVNQIARMRYTSGGRVTVPLVVRTPILMGVSAGPQHSDTPHAMFTHFPGLKVALPASPRDAKGLLKSAIRDDDPVVFFESLALRRLREEVPDEEELIPLGQAKTVLEGSDATVVALGSTVQQALGVAERLADEGISIELIDPRTTVPMDWDSVLTSVHKTGRLVAVDDATPLCSMAGEIIATVSEAAYDALRAPPVRVTRLQTPIPFSAPLEKSVLVDEEKIERAVRRVLGSGR